MKVKSLWFPTRKSVWSQKMMTVLMLLAFSFTMTSCGELLEGIFGEEENPANSEFPVNNEEAAENSVPVNGTIELPIPNVSSLLQKCKVISTYDEADIDGSSFKTFSKANDLLETYYVTDEDSKVYFITRNQWEFGSSIKIDVQSSALAIATLHPFFSPVNGADYDEIINRIKSSSKYQTYYNQVEKAIEQQKDLFDPSNVALIEALTELYDDVLSDIDWDAYSNPIAIASARALTRGIQDKIDPTYIQLNLGNNVLTLNCIGLTPSYYGTVTNASGTSVNYNVLTRSDYGGMDLFLRNVDDMHWGPASSFIFSTEGDYQFFLSRTNAAATADFYMNLGNSILTVLNLDANEDNRLEIVNNISQHLLAEGTGAYEPEMEPLDYLGIVYSATLEYLTSERFLQNQALSNASTFQLNIIGRILRGALEFYNIGKGIINSGVRIAYALNAPPEIRFCACYYNGSIDTCTEASLTIVDGDEQEGNAEEQLPTALKVYVQTIGDDDLYHNPSSNHRIKYEVVEGGGTVSEELVPANEDKTAEVFWTLGKEGEQKVKAVVIDLITDKEVGEPVYFTATLLSAPTLTKLSGDNQEGKPNIMLDSPLVVSVSSDTEMSNSNYRVKFEVIAGEGTVESSIASISNNTAETSWTLGEEGVQMVRAIVIDLITDKEVSEPVYFTATLTDTEEPDENTDANDDSTADNQRVSWGSILDIYAEPKHYRYDDSKGYYLTYSYSPWSSDDGYELRYNLYFICEPNSKGHLVSAGREWADIDGFHSEHAITIQGICANNISITSYDNSPSDAGGLSSISLCDSEEYAIRFFSNYIISANNYDLSNHFYWQSGDRFEEHFSKLQGYSASLPPGDYSVCIYVVVDGQNYYSNSVNIHLPKNPGKQE